MDPHNEITQQFDFATDWLAVSTGGEHTLGLKTTEHSGAGVQIIWAGVVLERIQTLPSHQQVGADTDWTTSDARPINTSA